MNELKYHMAASRRQIKTGYISSLTCLPRPLFKIRCSSESL